MKIRPFIKRVLGKYGYRIVRVPENDGIYEFDGMISIHNHDFMADQNFIRAYARGVAAAEDYQWYWRVHIGLWAAKTASRLEGDFVECGVNRGFLSSSIMEALNWNSLNKTFYLLDTFGGLDRTPDGASSNEATRNKKHIESGFYVTDSSSVRANFSEWKNVRIIEGTVPKTLHQIDAEKVAYAHLDMNAAAPEVAALEFLWERLVPGAIILLDDYAFYGYVEQKKAMDAAAARKSVAIASLPTGQGLIVKT